MTLDSTRQPRIAISVSESPDMAAFGLGAGHLRHAMAELALFLLSSGKTLVYGGDLRDQGFTELLFQLVLRYRRAGDHSAKVVDYLAWPVHIRMKIDELASRARSTSHLAQLVLLREHGEVLTMKGRQALPSHEPRRRRMGDRPDGHAPDYAISFGRPCHPRWTGRGLQGPHARHRRRSAVVA